MKRLMLITICVIIFVAALELPVISADDYFPIRPGMSLVFNQVFEHVVQKEKTWKVTIVKSAFPESLTFTWIKSQKDGKESSGARILTDLQYSRNFNPWFKNDESKATNDTAPWLSLDLLKELTETGSAEKFREGGTGALNWAPLTLRVKEKVIYPLLINGKPEALTALQLNKGIVVWDNVNNPLVLEYEPLGVPFFTSISGWKLTEINY